MRPAPMASAAGPSASRVRPRPRSRGISLGGHFSRPRHLLTRGVPMTRICGVPSDVEHGRSSRRRCRESRRNYSTHVSSKFVRNLLKTKKSVHNYSTQKRGVRESRKTLREGQICFGVQRGIGAFACDEIARIPPLRSSRRCPSKARGSGNKLRFRGARLPLQMTGEARYWPPRRRKPERCVPRAVQPLRVCARAGYPPQRAGSLRSDPESPALESARKCVRASFAARKRLPVALRFRARAADCGADGRAPPS